MDIIKCAFSYNTLWGTLPGCLFRHKLQLRSSQFYEKVQYNTPVPPDQLSVKGLFFSQKLIKYCIILICLQVAPPAELLLKGKITFRKRRYVNWPKALQRR